MQKYIMELSGRSSSERLDNQREILTNGGEGVENHEIGMVKPIWLFTN